jgi:hypothetical protein
MRNAREPGEKQRRRGRPRDELVPAATRQALPILGLYWPNCSQAYLTCPQKRASSRAFQSPSSAARDLRISACLGVRPRPNVLSRTDKDDRYRAPAKERETLPMATVGQIQIRCAGCHRRLGDLVNEIHSGQVIFELKCPRCGQPHLEIIRPVSSTPSGRQ